VPVAHTVAQADAGRAHELMQERRHVGKILLVRA
jgi:NADPH:quinone reductase-like Zn-dependent oxidoreductase